MIRVKILSGPQAGQVNLLPLEIPHLWVLAERGWRWELNYPELSDDEAFEWGLVDQTLKVVSALRRGSEVRFMRQVWRAPATDMGTVVEVAEAIEDHVSTAGYHLVIGEDTDSFFEIRAYDAGRGIFV
jgi:hypothetical protein